MSLNFHCNQNTDNAVEKNPLSQRELLENVIKAEYM